jgi:hypothetical protein
MTLPLLLTPYQHQRLLEPIPNERVSVANKQSHLEQWDVRRTLTRYFGIGGWTIETKRLWLIAQVEVPPGAVLQTKWIDGKKHENVPNDKSLWTVIYGAEVTLTVHGLNGSSAHWEDGATGDSQNQPTLGDAHDMALKTALSQAMKRAAVNLGDQFGLSLYNKGNRNQVVHGTLAPYLLLDPAAPAAVDALPERDEQVETSHDPTLDAHGEDGVDDGQTYATPPSGGLGDDMRDADTHPLPPARPTPPAAPPVDETAAQRAIREQRRKEAERYAPKPTPAAPPPPPATATDPEASALVDAILGATTSDQVERLWTAAGDLKPAGARTDVRPYLTLDALRVADPFLAAVKVDVKHGEPVPAGALVVAAGRHLEAEGGMSFRDHINADTATVGPDGRATNPPADAIPAR